MKASTRKVPFYIVFWSRSRSIRSPGSLEFRPGGDRNLGWRDRGSPCKCYVEVVIFSMMFLPDVVCADVRCNTTTLWQHVKSQ